MPTASQLLDHLCAELTKGRPLPPGAWIRISECPGREPNWIAEVSAPLPLAIAERWAGVLAELQWNAPSVDFSAAGETLDGPRSVRRDIGAAGGNRALALAATADPNRKGVKFVLRWIAGIPLALAVAVAAFIAMAE
jgi:hypothetical protein